MLDLNATEVLNGAPVTGLPNGQFIDGQFTLNSDAPMMNGFDPGAAKFSPISSRGRRRMSTMP